MPGIIVGVDGSAHSRKALERAIHEAAAHHTSLTVLTVHQAVRDVYGVVSSYPGDADLTEKARQAAKAETDEVVASLGVQPESITVTAVHGLPAEEIVKAAQGADMVVMGSRGAGGFARLLMGSTATQVANYAHCAVLILPADERS
ncbi:MAG TPA: universal stress protein [Streptosporangiaceae bacterium]|nr:universal stress protein [Streptosporangiaceae bacterium]